jgi:hypothetical protein
MQISLISRCFLALMSKYSPQNTVTATKNMLNDQNDCHTHQRTYVETSNSEILFWDRQKYCCYVAVNDILFDIEDFSVPVHSRTVLSVCLPETTPPP